MNQNLYYRPKVNEVFSYPFIWFINSSGGGEGSGSSIASGGGVTVKKIN
jgi:hypothetical protein